MKVYISSAGYFSFRFGGGQVYTYRLAKELLRRGHDVIILTSGPWNGGDETYRIDNYSNENIPIIVFALNPKSINYIESQLGGGPLTTQIVEKILSDYKPDIVYINGIKPSLVSICNRMNIPHVVTVHHAGIICPSGALVKTDGVICDRKVNSRDCVPCCNFWRRPKWYTGGILAKIPSFIYRPMGKRLSDSKSLSYIEKGLIYSYLVEQSINTKKMLIEQAQHFIAPSRAMHDLLIRNGCNAKKITIIPHGIEPLEKTPFEKLNGRLIRLGYVGRIDRLKGLHVILEALELLADGYLCELHIFGATRNPWDEIYFKKTLNTYKGRAKVFDHGFIQLDKIMDVYSMIDVLVVPSLLPEAFGLVVAEAFSAGRPVIVFNSGALPEQVIAGANGFIIKNNDSKSLAEAVEKLIDNPDLIIRMSHHISPVKTIQEYVDELEVVYSRVLIRKSNS